MVRSERSAPPRVSTHPKRPAGACEAPRQMARLCAGRSRGGGRFRMISARLEAYLSRLQHELQKHGLVDTTIIDEVREHLLDAVAAGLRRGLSVDAAEHEAFVRFGPPDMVAAGFANERYRMLKRLVIVLSKIGGLLRG